MTMGSPFRTKYENEPAYKQVKPIELRCLKDGSLRRFKDDGPFDSLESQKTPHSGRDNVLRQMEKRMPDPFGGPDDTVPVYVLDEDAAMVKVWDRRINRYAQPERMNERYRKVMAHYISQRDSIALKAEEAKKAKQAEADAKAQAGVDTLLAALGERVGKTKPAKQAGAL